MKTSSASYHRLADQKSERLNEVQKMFRYDLLCFLADEACLK